MKGFIFLLLVIPLISNGQSSISLSGLIETSPATSLKREERQLEKFVAQLKTRKTTSDILFLKRVFHETERSFLSHYEPYSGFNELFTSGNYDCLTATSLFSVVLDQLHFKFRMIETNYHIFLLVNTGEGEVLLETTDRFGGFVTKPKEIQRRIGGYRNASSSLSGQGDTYQYHFDLYHEVTGLQLPGLLYYNQAVKAYNDGKFEDCAEFLLKAQSVYNSPRIGELYTILLKSVAASKLDDHKKQRIADRLKSLALKPAILASR